MVLASCAMTLGLVVPKAHADPFGMCNADVGCIPDAGDHTYCFEASMC
jgi:hypothetical protein